MITAYVPPGPTAPHACQVSYRHELAYGSSGVARNSMTYFQYDKFGNVDHVREIGDPQDPTDDRLILRSYRPATGPCIVGLPWFEQRFAGAGPAAPLLRSTYYCYDGDNGTASVNCSGMPSKGLLTAVQAVDDTGH
ncbi:hypothetical protein [Streptomyces wuyuanensis]|uniref:hypothetical protein n=1 Tax=Streptomyces wuyuanensis TaxID=1196353 RepID=UPI003D7666B0